MSFSPTYSPTDPTYYLRTPTFDSTGPSKDPTSPTWLPPSPIHRVQTPEFDSGRPSRDPASTLYSPRTPTPAPTFASGDTAMLQLMENSAKANRTLRALEKENKSLLAIAERDLTEYKHAMAEFQYEMAHATATFAADAEFRSLSSHHLWLGWTAKCKEAQEIYVYSRKRTAAHMSNVAWARNACARAARAQDDFLVRKGLLDGKGTPAWNDSDDFSLRLKYRPLHS